MNNCPDVSKINLEINISNSIFISCILFEFKWQILTLRVRVDLHFVILPDTSIEISNFLTLQLHTWKWLITIEIFSIFERQSCRIFSIFISFQNRSVPQWTFQQRWWYMNHICTSSLIPGSYDFEDIVNIDINSMTSMLYKNYIYNNSNNNNNN